MSEDDTHTKDEHIKKKRTTALKIIVDEKTKKSPLEQRIFLGNLFDYPQYYEQKDRIIKRCKTIIEEREYNLVIDENMQRLLKANNIDPSTFAGYFEETVKEFPVWYTGIVDKIREVTGMTHETTIEYQYASEDQNNGITIYSLKFRLETEGKTKTEIKTIHRANVEKLLNYLRMRKVPVSYDCEWSFEGNRACTI